MLGYLTRVTGVLLQKTGRNIMFKAIVQRLMAFFNKFFNLKEREKIIPLDHVLISYRSDRHSEEWKASFRGKITPAFLHIKNENQEKTQECFVLDFGYMCSTGWSSIPIYIRQLKEDCPGIEAKTRGVVFKQQSLSDFELAMMIAELCQMNFAWVGLMKWHSSDDETKSNCDFRIIYSPYNPNLTGLRDDSNYWLECEGQIHKSHGIPIWARW